MTLEESVTYAKPAEMGLLTPEMIESRKFTLKKLVDMQMVSPRWARLTPTIFDSGVLPKEIFNYLTDDELYLIFSFDRISKLGSTGRSRDQGGPHYEHNIDHIETYVNGMHSLGLPLDSITMAIMLMHDYEEINSELESSINEYMQLDRKKHPKKASRLSQHIASERHKIAEGAIEAAMSIIPASQIKDRALFYLNVLRVISATDMLTRYPEELSFHSSMGILHRVNSFDFYSNLSNQLKFQHILMRELGLANSSELEPITEVERRILVKTIDRIALMGESTPRYTEREIEEGKILFSTLPELRHYYGKDVSLSPKNVPLARNLHELYRTAIVKHFLHGFLNEHRSAISGMGNFDAMPFNFLQAIKYFREISIRNAAALAESTALSYRKLITDPEAQEEYGRFQIRLDKRLQEDTSYQTIVTRGGPIRRGYLRDVSSNTDWEMLDKGIKRIKLNMNDAQEYAVLFSRFMLPLGNNQRFYTFANFNLRGIEGEYMTPQGVPGDVSVKWGN